MIKDKCIFVIGTESSGSMYIAKIISHVLGVQEYGTWDGGAWSASENSKNLVCHRSQPYGADNTFSDIKKWNEEYSEYDIKYVICTRDITISEFSRKKRWPNRNFNKFPDESNKAKNIIYYVMNNNSYMIWSYETFMFLKEPYLFSLYNFLDVKSNFIPRDIKDANKKYIISI